MPTAPIAADGSAPALNAELHKLRRAAQERVLGRHCPPGPNALAYAPRDGDQPSGSAEASAGAAGHFVPIGNEAALMPFHQALARLAAGQDPDGKVRILAYGASHTQADVYPGYLRAYLQSRFGDGGQGFVLIGRVNSWYRTLDTQAWHKELTVHHARYRDNVQDEPLGLFGAALVGRRGGGYGEIVTSGDSPNTRFELHYFRQRGGGDFSVRVDGKAIARIQTGSSMSGPAYHAFETTPGLHRIRAELVGNGPVRLFGVVAETSTPGVVVDTLGIGGARMTSQLRWQEQTWMDAVRRREPDLITFAYGTNETLDRGRSIARYERQVRAVLTRVRAALPHVSCVMLGPFELPRPHRARFLSVIDVQRRLSKEFGCGFWDGYAFMGGQEGSMQRWASVQPPLASPDQIHLTRLGYVYAGIAIGDALMRAYDSGRAYPSSTTAGGAAPAPAASASVSPPSR